MTRRTASNGSGGTWSRHLRNSTTRGSGKMPSPDEMICPSLMYVGPSRSAAIRSRREMSAVDVSFPRSRTAQTASGRPSARTVVSMRPTGGRRR